MLCICPTWTRGIYTDDDLSLLLVLSAFSLYLTFILDFPRMNHESFLSLQNNGNACMRQICVCRYIALCQNI